MSLQSRDMGDASDLTKRLFINDEQELRSGWRVLAFTLLLIVVVLFLTILLGLVGALIPPLGRFLVQAEHANEATSIGLIYFAVDHSISLASALLATWACARVLEQRSLSSAGYRLHKGWVRDFGLGWLLGLATLSLAVAISAIAGKAHVWPSTHTAGAALKWFLVPFGLFLIAAAWEEVMIRGFPFQALAHNLGPAAALAITSVIFGLLHLRNPDATTLSTINTILAGVWLGVAYLKTRSLWLATALHFAWNFATAFVFGLPVSGVTSLSQQPLISVGGGGPVWLTGGSYGPEGGVVATIAFIASTLVIWKSGLFAASEEMVIATRHGSREIDTRLTDGDLQP